MALLCCVTHSEWPSQNKCLQSNRSTIEQRIENSAVKPVDPEVAAMLLNDAALNAVLWLASSASPRAMLPKTLGNLLPCFCPILSFCMAFCRVCMLLLIVVVLLLRVAANF
jgi:hypothetical protein